MQAGAVRDFEDVPKVVSSQKPMRIYSFGLSGKQ
jgi:hypothetical protein